MDRRAAIRNEPIAIVGASCRFPGADGLDAFWQLLISGTDAVSEIDPQRWATRLFYHPGRAERGKSYTWAAGLIDGVDLFEPSFFGISPREAVQMDPQQRLLLEVAWHAFEDAGIPPSRVRNSDTGVYIGASATDYSDLWVEDPAAGDSHFMAGNALSILANRISYVFDLRGPSLTIDTACSSSLVALHQACEAIHSGAIKSAVVGGVNLLLAPYPFFGFCRASMLSRRGRCFAFDERADGYVRSEGAGVVILKPLTAALADHDPIRAVVLATGCNSDGRTIGLSLPSEAAQAELLTSIYRDADLGVDDLALFEMHGTGTPAGDPVEAAAVGHVIGARRRTPLPIGSVKTNIGHLEPASGMAGLLKAMLVLEHGVVPATLNCENPNPNIDFKALNLRLVCSAEEMAIREQRTAGVNSFGFGGTNAHAVLGTAPPPPVRWEASRPQPPLLISAATEASLRELAGGWRALLAQTSEERAPELLRAAARGRNHLTHRLVVTGSERTATMSSLDRFLSGAAPELITAASVAGARLAFVFAGNGAQYPAMGRRALHASTAFRAAVDKVDRVLRPELGWSVAEKIEGGVEAIETACADIAQPLLFAIQYGIVEALRANGVIADGYIGHSVGEISAAWAAGALTLADAARIMVARSRSQQRTKGTGRMAALALGCEAASEFLARIGSSAEIAALNTAQSVTVSGTADEIAQIAAAADDRGLWCRVLDLDFAFHSRLMEPIRDELWARLDGVSSRSPATRMMSTVTGTAIENDILDIEHWWRNIRNPVRFNEALAVMIAEGFRMFVEIGPSPILRSYLTDGLRAADVESCVLASLKRDDDDSDPFPAIAAQCYVSGYDWPSAPCFDGNTEPRGVPLYPWNRQRYWLDKTVEAAELVNPPFDHPLLGFRQPGHWPAWRNYLGEQVLPWIADHAVEGFAVYPAAAVIETALAAARWRWPDASVLEVAEVEIRRPLPFDKGRLRELRLALTSDDGDWELVSRPRLSSEPMSLHAVGRIAAANRLLVSPQPIDTPATGRMDGDALYRLADLKGLNYGRRFRAVDHVEVFGFDRATVHLTSAAIDEPLDAYLLHPALLDSAMQGLLALLALSGHESTEVGFLPWRFERVRLKAPFGRISRNAHLRLTRFGVRSISIDLWLYDEAGDVVAELSGCWLRAIELGLRSTDKYLYRVDLVPAPLIDDRGRVELLATARSVLAGIVTSRISDAKPREEGALLDAMVGAAAFGLWRTLVLPGEPFTIQQLAIEGRISAAATELAEDLLRAIERLGAASEVDGEWRIESDTDLPEAGEIWRMLLADAPDLVSELAVLGATFEALPDMLAGGPASSQPAQAGTVEHLLQASPAATIGFDVIDKTLAAIAADWPAHRPLRILEIGADCGTTRRFLHRLAKFPIDVVYMATTDDPTVIDRLAAVIEPFAGAMARRWVPGSAVETIGNARFDIVLGINSCARAMLDTKALKSLDEVITPGGLFLAVEPEPHVLWHMVSSWSSDWQSKGRSGAAISPLRSREEWGAELADAGFSNVEAASMTVGPWPLVLFWGYAPSDAESATTQPMQSRAIAVIANDTPLRQALVDRLVTTGYQVTMAEPINYLSALNQITEDGVTVFIADVSERDSAAGQIATLARLAHTAAERHAALWVVTKSAQQATASCSKTGLAQAAAWGIARVLANELPRLPLRVIDVDGGSPANVHARQIAHEISSATPETAIVWGPHRRHVMRLRKGLLPHFAQREQALTLVGGATGGLQSIGWGARETHPLGPGEVEIEVRAAGLNFRDVLWAMGMLPEEALIDGFAGSNFGLECAGIVRAVGTDVRGVAIDDRVMALASAALGTQVVTVADAVVQIPARLDFAAAATLPVAFVTAIYALGHLAQIDPDEYVLIHAAAGGVGLAAIQYAKHRGAVVIATAGSPIKRTFLQLAGADHVLDSRDPAFVDAVRGITDGEGVDVVLNSLSGEAMERSLEVLKPFGRFLELGKRDFYQNRRLHMRPLRHNVSYFAIDVDQLPRHRPALVPALLREVCALIDEGAIRPLAHRVFRYSQVEDAFRVMQASAHIGKLVLVPDPDVELQLRPTNDFAACRDGTYLITGGIEGFGFEAARWLADRGAGALALLGRRGTETPDCARRIAELEAAGAVVGVYRGDVADRAALAAVLCEIRATLPPLRGVVHAASVIDDHLTSDLDNDGINRVFRPKLDGAWALHELTRDDPIELFLLFSSATTLIGAPGQGAYVAANTALEALARERHAEGRPALAIAWGPIEDAGYLAARRDMREALVRRLATTPLTAAQALAALPAMLASGLPVVAVATADWGKTRHALPLLSTPMFSEIRYQDVSLADEEAIADTLDCLDPDAALALLQSIVSEEVARILRLSPDTIVPARPLSQLGMDSLMAVELRLALEARLRVDLPLLSLGEGTSVASIAARLGSALFDKAEDSELTAMVARYEANSESIAVAAAGNSGERGATRK
jgi:acyl transferase domain-containing protein/acyl carrier protein